MNRHPAGDSRGGRFAPGKNPEPNLDLAAERNEIDLETVESIMEITSELRDSLSSLGSVVSDDGFERLSEESRAGVREAIRVSRDEPYRLAGLINAAAGIEIALADDASNGLSEDSRARLSSASKNGVETYLLLFL